MENGDQDPPGTERDVHADMSNGPRQDPVGDSSSTGPQRFSYEDLKLITDDFKERIGKGGFGPVFFGKLPGVGTPVAVKMRIRSPAAAAASSQLQGDKQFLAEVRYGELHI